MMGPGTLAERVAAEQANWDTHEAAYKVALLKDQAKRARDANFAMWMAASRLFQMAQDENDSHIWALHVKNTWKRHEILAPYVMLVDDAKKNAKAAKMKLEREAKHERIRAMRQT